MINHPINRFILNPHWICLRFSYFLLTKTAFLVLLLSCTLILPLNSYGSQGNTIIPFFKANYDANIQGFSVKASREYKAINNTISELSFTADSFLASLSETSQFTWRDGEIRPLRFTHIRTIFGQSTRKTLSFDWDNNQIINTDKGKTTYINNEAAALDRLSFQLQLQHDLISKHLENKIYRIADKKKIKEYSFKVLGDEILETKIGKLNTIKIIVDRENNDRSTYIWLAKDWQNLLVKLEQYEEGDEKFSIQLTKAMINGKKVSGL